MNVGTGSQSQEPWFTRSTLYQLCYPSLQAIYKRVRDSHSDSLLAEYLVYYVATQQNKLHVVGIPLNNDRNILFLSISYKYNGTSFQSSKCVRLIKSISFSHCLMVLPLPVAYFVESSTW